MQAPLSSTIFICTVRGHKILHSSQMPGIIGCILLALIKNGSVNPCPPVNNDPEAQRTAISK